MAKLKSGSDVEDLNFACYQIGLFMQSFALMESSLDAAMASALNLDDLQKQILSTNIDFAKKVRIVNVALTVSYVSDKMTRHYTRHLKKILELNTDRVMVAHTPFGEGQDSCSIQFLRTTAVDDLSLEPITWSGRDLETKLRTMERIRGKLKDLEHEFKKAEIVKEVAEAIFEGKTPSPGIEVQDLEGLRQRHSQALNHSAPHGAKRKKPPQTPPKQQE